MILRNRAGAGSAIMKYLSSFLLSPLILSSHEAPARFRVRCFVHLVMCMNMRFMAYKLQSALSQRGEHYKINQLQSYSVRHDRMVTKYVVEKAVPGQPRGERVLETYSMADVVKTLAKIYSG